MPLKIKPPRKTLIDLLNFVNNIHLQSEQTRTNIQNHLESNLNIIAYLTLWVIFGGICLSLVMTFITISSTFLVPDFMMFLMSGVSLICLSYCIFNVYNFAKHLNKFKDHLKSLVHPNQTTSKLIVKHFKLNKPLLDNMLITELVDLYHSVKEFDKTSELKIALHNHQLMKAFINHLKNNNPYSNFLELEKFAAQFPNKKLLSEFIKHIEKNHYSDFDRLDYFIRAFENNSLIREFLNHLKNKNTYSTFLKLLNYVMIEKNPEAKDLTLKDKINQYPNHYMNCLIRFDITELAKQSAPTYSLMWQAASKIKHLPLNVALSNDALNKIKDSQAAYQIAGLN